MNNDNNISHVFKYGRLKRPLQCWWAKSGILPHGEIDPAFFSLNHNKTFPWNRWPSLYGFIFRLSILLTLCSKTFAISFYIPSWYTHLQSHISYSFYSSLPWKVCKYLQPLGNPESYLDLIKAPLERLYSRNIVLFVTFQGYEM